MSIDLIERRIIEVERELCSEEVELDSMISSLNEKYKKEKILKKKIVMNTWRDYNYISWIQLEA